MTEQAAGISKIEVAMSVNLKHRLGGLTPARIGLRRAGISLATGEVLDFQLDHARARDAVHMSLDVTSLLARIREIIGSDPIELLSLHSAALDRKTYLQRPDLGRKLNDASRGLLAACRSEFDLAIVIADGLSAFAIERQAVPLLAALWPKLEWLRIAPVCVVEQGRVAIGDEVASWLGAEMVVVLIGERPGLSSPDSLGAYITWLGDSGKQITDAERNCISNIRAEGLSHADASERLNYYIREARLRRLTGVAIKDPEIMPALDAGGRE